MKKWVYNNLELVLVVLMVVAIVLPRNTYNKTAVVDKIEGHVIYVVDKGGDIWIFDSKDNTYTIGQKVKLKMHNNYTNNTKYDDVILEVKRSK